jgi:hypothetical protein
MRRNEPGLADEWLFGKILAGTYRSSLMKFSWWVKNISAWPPGLFNQASDDDLTAYQVLRSGCGIAMSNASSR